MIQKKTLIESIVNKLAGGDSPADVRGTYHPLRIQTVIGMIFDDLVNDNPNIAQEMAQDFPITVSDTTPFVATLPKYAMGVAGIYEIKFGAQQFYAVSPLDYSQLNKVNPSSMLAKLSSSNTVTLNHKPPQNTGTILYLPNFKNLGSEDGVILESNETKLWDMVVQRMRQEGPQEKMNNSVRDIGNVAARK